VILLSSAAACARF